MLYNEDNLVKLCKYHSWEARIQLSVFVVKLFQFAWDENSWQRIFLLQISHPFLQHFSMRGQVLLQIYETQTRFHIFSHGKKKVNCLFQEWGHKWMRCSLSMQPWPKIAPIRLPLQWNGSHQSCVCSPFQFMWKLV